MEPHEDLKNILEKIKKILIYLFIPFYLGGCSFSHLLEVGNITLD